MKAPWFGIALLSIFLAIWIGWEFADPRSQAMLRQPEGSIASGTFMGAHVGEATSLAIEKIRDQGYADVISYAGGDSAELPGGRLVFDPTRPESVIVVQQSQTVVELRDRSWRNAMVILIDDEGRVVHILWRFQPFHLPF